MYINKKLGLYTIILLFSLWGISLTAQEGKLPPPRKGHKITIINSYHRGNSWNEDLMKGETKIIQSEFPNSDILVEYLDLRRFPMKERYKPILEDIALKNQVFNTELLIINSREAYDVIMANRETLFPGIPIVYAGVPKIPEIAKERPSLNMTGVAEMVDLYNTLDIALNIHKEVNKIYVIIDTLPSSQPLKRDLMKLEKGFSSRARFIYLEHYSMDELQRQISQLSKDSLVLYTSFNIDKNRLYFSTLKSISLVSHASSVPVYSIFSLGLGEGVVGGYLLDGTYLGDQVGKLAVRIIKGESASDIEPIKLVCPPMFDYKALKRWHISENDLPPESLIINKPNGFLIENRIFMIHIIAAIITLIFIILVLSILSFMKSKTQELFKQKEEYLRITLNSIGDGVIATDEDGSITRINPEAVRLTGWLENEAIGKPLSTVFNLSNFFIEEGEEIMGSFLISREKKKYPITHHAAPIKGDEGELRGSVLIFRDISEEMELQEKLKQSDKMNAIGQLAGGIAHDFNNMLSEILGAAELMEEYIEPKGKGEALRMLIINSSKRAAELTNKLLVFARKSPSLTREVNLHSIIKETVAILENTIDKRISIQSNLLAYHSNVIGDNLLLQNALMNLCINASQAITERGFIKISTTNITVDNHHYSQSVTNIQPGRYIEMEVSDSGCGIPPSILPHLFEPFFTTKKKEEGTGLGLAAVYGTVEQHNGTISVFSEEGFGTRFHILLPLA
jgi:two-component system, cell cycle sensor histidine kinase and response regulator CckA